MRFRRAYADRGPDPATAKPSGARLPASSDCGSSGWPSRSAIVLRPVSAMSCGGLRGSGRTRRMSTLHLPLEQVANLGEQFLVFCQRRALGFFLPEMHDPAQELHDEKEEGRGHDQEVDDISKEQTVLNVLTFNPEHPVFIALVAREDDADNWHDNVIDQRLDDVAEGAADDHAHGQVDHIPFERELPELVEYGECLLGRNQVFQVHGRSYCFVSQQIRRPATQARFPWAAA